MNLLKLNLMNVSFPIIILCVLSTFSTCFGQKNIAYVKNCYINKAFLNIPCLIVSSIEEKDTIGIDTIAFIDTLTFDYSINKNYLFVNNFYNLFNNHNQYPLIYYISVFKIETKSLKKELQIASSKKISYLKEDLKIKFRQKKINIDYKSKSISYPLTKFNVKNLEKLIIEFVRNN